MPRMPLFILADNSGKSSQVCALSPHPLKHARLFRSRQRVDRLLGCSHDERVDGEE
jgi:hypothetical protein